MNAVYPALLPGFTKGKVPSKCLSGVVAHLTAAKLLCLDGADPVHSWPVKGCLNQTCPRLGVPSC